MKRRNLMKTVAAAALALGLAPATLSAQEVTLRLHQFLPPPAPVPAHILKPWAAAVEARLDGKLKIEHYDAMSLGGRPNDLIDQAIDGTAVLIVINPSDADIQQYKDRALEEELAEAELQRIAAL